MLKKQGYKTAVIGKWHLGLGDGSLYWNGEIKPGPLEIGFDHCYLIPATGDRVPCVWVEDHRVVNLDPDDPIMVSYSDPVGDLPTGLSQPGLLKQGADVQHSNTIINGISRIGYMSGGTAAWWKDEDFADILVEKAQQFIRKNQEEPFFLFFSYHDIHVPRVVHPRFQGSSEMGPRGDAIVQMDWCTGQITNLLSELDLLENTLIIFTSDNGPVLNDGYMDQAEELVGDHEPSGPFRGGKYSNFEAGTRIPTIAVWPGTIRPGISDALVGQVDIYASLAALVGFDLEEGEAPDSYNLLDTWTGRSPVGREVLLEEAYSLSIRKGPWKYISPIQNAGPPILEGKNIETGRSSFPQLYNLDYDLGEQNNLIESHKKEAEELATLLQQIIDQSGSRPE
jgi:arylsulfatase A-like enzyme